MQVYFNSHVDRWKSRAHDVSNSLEWDNVYTVVIAGERIVGITLLMIIIYC